MTDPSKISPTFQWMVQQAESMGLGVAVLPDASVCIEQIPVRLLTQKSTGEKFAAIDPVRLLWLLQIFLRMKTLEAAALGREAEVDAILNRPRARRELN